MHFSLGVIKQRGSQDSCWDITKKPKASRKISKAEINLKVKYENRKRILGWERILNNTEPIFTLEQDEHA